jgi:glycosyltransferase involved in cell wall biosynthesis
VKPSFVCDSEYQFVIGSLDVGGAETHLARVLPRLAERGYRVSVLVYWRRGVLADKLQGQGVQVISNRPLAGTKDSWWQPTFWAAVFGCVRFLMANVCRADNAVVCLFLPHAYLLGAPAHYFARSRSRLIVFRRSLNNYQNRNIFLRWVERKLHAYPDQFVANSAAVSRQLIKEEAVSDQKTTLIYNGIDLQEFDSELTSKNARLESGAPVSSILLVVVANLLPYKGHIDLLRALSLLSKEAQRNVFLVSVGGGLDARKDLKELASELALDRKIAWLGSRADVPNLLSCADIGVLPSHEEGFSNAILEGMAASLPMVVTDVGGNAEAVIDGETGLVVPSKDPQALAVALERLINDAELRRLMGSAGRERVAQHFSLDSCVNAYEALFHEVLRSR